MTEAEWLNCTDPAPMLDFIRAKVSDRKLRLFAFACVRRIWHLLKDDVSRGAIEIAERFVDGQATAEEVVDACAWIDAASAACEAAVASAAFFRTYPEAIRAARGAANAARSAVDAARDNGMWGDSDNVPAEARAQTFLLRDICGNPSRTISIDPILLAWNDSTVSKIAQAIYDERAFERLPILADALEDAGCGDADLLRHCREPGEHVRGCWAVDLLLGKQ
jgi:hypothetical protein